MPTTVSSEQHGMRRRLDAFPSQLVLTIAWVVIGVPLCIWLRSSILWVALMSVYAICVGHWAAHLAWRAKREAQHNEAEVKP